MTIYEDDAVSLGELGITIKNYLYPRNTKFIPYESINRVELVELGPLTGRHRLVGLGFGRPGHFFHWDRLRSKKTHAIALDTGRVIRTVISPAAAGPVLDLLEQEISSRGSHPIASNG